MIKLLFVTLLLLTTTSRADFIDANNNYQNGKFNEAFAEFSVLAKFGNIKSQFNLAVMYYNGEGTNKDIVKAYAWIKLVDTVKEYKNIAKKIKNNLSDEQIIKAEEVSSTLYKKYANINSQVILGPTTLSTKDNIQNNRPNAQLKLIKSIAPKYPMNLLRENIQGWVDLMFNVYPDGSVRDIQVTESIPKGGFDKVAIKAVQMFKFSYESDDQKIEFNEPITTQQRIKFLIGRHGTQTMSKKLQTYLDEIIQKAKDGDAQAQYTYAIIYDGFLENKGTINADQVNDWLFQSAQDGNINAQYKLGKKIYFGKDCKVEKQKGLDWIMSSAQIGNANAQFMAYQMLQNKSVINRLNQLPSYWLEQAAKNGSIVAQLNFAKEVGIKPNPSKTELKKAKGYLKNYVKKAVKTAQWYQVNALVQSKLHNKSAAVKSMKSAIKIAKKAGWNMVELNNQLISIQENNS